jgi:hypothetical protein
MEGDDSSPPHEWGVKKEIAQDRLVAVIRVDEQIIEQMVVEYFPHSGHCGRIGGVGSNQM